MDKFQLERVIQKCKLGDKHAFKHLMCEYMHYVFTLAFRILANEEDAKDISQETFIRLWQNIKRYDENTKITTWMYKICTNLCLDKLKSQKRKPLEYHYKWEQNFKQKSDENNVEQIENQQLSEIILALTKMLSTKQKLVFVLKDLQDLSTGEIEQITGLNRGQIKSNLYYARQEIKKKLIKIGYEVF